MLPRELDIEAVRALRDTLGDRIVRTPVVRAAAIEARIGGQTKAYAKLEFLQQTGTFKARGALAVTMQLDDEQRRAGITTVSAGNHAIAAAFAAKTIGTSAKVVMLGSANPFRVAKAKSYGAEVLVVDDVHEAFAAAERIQQEEGRYFVHPFEGPYTSQGTATIGLEISEQLDDFDAVIVPIGGGGLCSGIASAVKQLRPGATVFGVEPSGADTMRRSLAAGSPQQQEKVSTIADSLGAPFALPFSFAVCRDNVDEVVLVSDDDLREGMRFLFHDMKLAVEPACVASTVALLGPLADRLRGARVALVMCGSNIDWASFYRLAFA